VKYNMFFILGISAYWSWSDGMELKNLHRYGNLRWSDAGLMVTLLFHKGKNMKVAVAFVLRAAE